MTPRPVWPSPQTLPGSPASAWFRESRYRHHGALSPFGVLGLWVDPASFQFQERLQSQAERRRHRMRSMCAAHQVGIARRPSCKPRWTHSPGCRLGRILPRPWWRAAMWPAPTTPFANISVRVRLRTCRRLAALVRDSHLDLGCRRRRPGAPRALQTLGRRTPSNDHRVRRRRRRCHRGGDGRQWRIACRSLRHAGRKIRPLWVRWDPTSTTRNIFGIRWVGPLSYRMVSCPCGESE